MSNFECKTKEIIAYIQQFLAGDELAPHIEYSDSPSKNAKLTIIKSSFFDKYGTTESLPSTPFPTLPECDNLPFLFGEPKLERSEHGGYILYADLIASAFFLMSRYEEIIKKDARDQWGRFLAKDSVIFQQGYGNIPLIDEWSNYLKRILKKTGATITEQKKHFSKIYLTHDIDFPFKLYNLKKLIKQYFLSFLKNDKSIKNILNVYRNEELDPNFTFPKIIEMDNSLKEAVKVSAESIYFVIARKGKEYCDIASGKFKKLSNLLLKGGATIGLHISHEGGSDPSTIKKELQRLKKYIPCAKNISRNHFLKWREPNHCSDLIQAKITEDFTLGYADCAGFRTGTCHPYYFIDPTTMRITSLLIHPLIVMECTLSEKKYMNLNYDSALSYCKELINQIYEHNGEVDILWHNTSFMDGSYHLKLYKELLSHITNLCNT